MELPTAYNAKETEDNIYKLWEQSGYFNPDECIKKGVCQKNAKAFSIVLPPPNVTGTLHMGHASMLAIEDTLVRYHRMKGEKTLWIPGTDHAGIATQAKVESDLYKKTKETRYDVGREKLLALVQQFAKESHDTIVHQVKKMGASLDWSREAYTLDEPRNKAVRTAFKTMYDQGLIYRGDRIVNWDPKMQTTVSDDEIEWKEETAPFYYLKYGPFIIGTARPETKFGDKFVVMHPKDKRYAQYSHGQTLQVDWLNGKITATVIKDTAVDMEFGTGVMTITPWHDRVDFEIAARHNLEKEQIIDLKRKLLPIAGTLAGTHISKARPLIVQRLQEKGLLASTDATYIHRVATNSRGGGVIEPQIMRQWFVAVTKEFSFPHAGLKGIRKGEKTTLKKLMLHAVKTKQIEILPKRFEKVYYHWINDLRDWCVSRQIWFGHQIPVYYCTQEISNSQFPISKQIQNPNDQNINMFVAAEKPTKCPICGSCTPQQDQDTLDTWFSSGLWTFSTLGWPFDSATKHGLAQGKPGQQNDFANYHPTSVLETGYDILFFWVARMILLSTYLTGQIPFKTVYLHGLVRDNQGRKMSKSLGNIINPLDMIDKYGADATRLSLIIGAGPGNDLKLSEDRVRGYRNFTNKLWNIGRFVAMNAGDLDLEKKPALSKEDKKILADFLNIRKSATKHLEAFRLSQAAEELYHYAWHAFADKVLEDSKTVLQNAQKKAGRQFVLKEVMRGLLTCLHPFTPFVTEAIYREMPFQNKKDLLLVETWK
ncbi:MAG: valine--tRNA ligase [Candidatus Wildermuthbacteria bacterium]|nr:valine--tRNA ligase [Candidatus Wildermuthbacteria bacterium]